MDLRRLRAGELLLALAGVALLAALFLPWYGDEASGNTLTGWEALSVLDAVLCLVALMALSVAVVTAVQRVAAVPIALEALVTLAGLAATLLVLFRVAFPPDGADGSRGALWLALLAAAGVATAAAVAMRDERLSSPDRPTDATGRPISQVPEVEARPAPPAGGGR